MAIGSDAIALTAREIGHVHIGALVGIETPAAIYVGAIWGLSIFEDTIFITVQREGAQSKAKVEPSQIVWVSTHPMEGERS